MIATYSESKTRAINNATHISNLFLLEQMPKAPENCLKVYLFAIMQYQNRYFYDENIADALGMSDDEVVKAFQYWQDMGVLRILRYDPVHIEFSDISNGEVFVSSHETRYAPMIAELREAFGTRVLSATELSAVYDWVEVFGLSEDVVVLMVKHCLDTKGKRVSVKYMGEVAKTWADAGIANTDEARERISADVSMAGIAGDIHKRWNTHRPPTDDEIAMCAKWNGEWKIPQGVIMSACELLVNAYHPSFGYLDSILRSYHDDGITDMRALAEAKIARSKAEELTRELLQLAGIKSKYTAAQTDKIVLWTAEWGISVDALRELAKYAEKTSRPFDFMARTAASWYERKIFSAEAAKNDLEAGAPTKNTRSRSKPKYEIIHHTYTDEELEKMTTNWGEEGDE